MGLALFGAGAAILLTFAVLLLFWRTPRLGGADAGRPLPDGLQRVLDGTPLRRALQAVALGLVEDHLGHCVAQAIEGGGPEAEEKVREASEAIARLVRS